MPQSAKKPNLHQVLSFILIFAFTWTGCGKVGDPVPPEIAFKQTIKDLTAQVERGAIVLRWSLPGQAGRADRVRILRNERNAGEACAGCYREYALLIDSPLNDARLRRSEKAVFSYHDEEVKPGYSYSYLMVVCDTLNYCGEKSNMAETYFQKKD